RHASPGQGPAGLWERYPAGLEAPGRPAGALRSQGDARRVAKPEGGGGAPGSAGGDPLTVSGERVVVTVWRARRRVPVTAHRPTFSDRQLDIRGTGPAPRHRPGHVPRCGDPQEGVLIR